jgi:hypothetical protein
MGACFRRGRGLKEEVVTSFGCGGEVPENQAETEKTNINLQHREKPVYSSITNLKFVDLTL